MTLGDELDELRSAVLRDTALPYLWSDDILLRYIRDAEHRFARHTLCIRDGATEIITQVTLETDVKNYVLDRSVLSVLSARYDTDKNDLFRSSHAIVAERLDTSHNIESWYVSGVEDTGRPNAYFTDETLVSGGVARVTLSVYPTPTTTENGKPVYLRVVRLPRTVYSLDNLSVESEIPEDYQLDCLDWAAYRALRNNDTDAGESNKAANFKSSFEEAVAQAIKEFKRTIFADTRIKYGENGFTYVR